MSYDPNASPVLVKKSVTPGCIYRIYDGDGVLLYIGSSMNPDARLKAHRKREWGGDIASVSLKWYPTASEADAAEPHVIYNERPLHNRDFNPAHGGTLRRRLPAAAA